MESEEDANIYSTGMGNRNSVAQTQEHNRNCGNRKTFSYIYADAIHRNESFVMPLVTDRRVGVYTRDQVGYKRL